MLVMVDTFCPRELMIALGGGVLQPLPDRKNLHMPHQVSVHLLFEGSKNDLVGAIFPVEMITWRPTEILHCS